MSRTPRSCSACSRCSGCSRARVASGERLDAVVARRPGVRSRTHAQRLIEHGLVKVDGAPSSKGHRVQPGERVEVELPEEAESTAEAVSFEVVHEDDYLMVVD